MLDEAHEHKHVMSVIGQVRSTIQHVSGEIAHRLREGVRRMAERIQFKMPWLSFTMKEWRLTFF